MKNVTSINQDGVSLVYGEFTLETDPKYAEQQVKDKIALVRSDLPDGIKEPVVKRMDPADQPVMIVSLTSDLPPTALYDVADTTVRDGLEQVPNVSNIDVIGGVKREIHVDLDLKKMKDYETSLTNVSQRVAGNSQNIPIGKVNRGARELSFRSLGEFRSIKQIQDVIVSFFASDVPVTISRLGRVFDSSEEQKTKGYLNGNSSLVLNIYKQSGSNSVDVSDGLQKRIKKLNSSMEHLKGAPKLVMVRDGARPIRMNLDNVKETIFEGIFLAIIVVYFFLGNFRSTLITVIALPNSLIGAFIFMGLAGFSINMMTLMALSLAVGLLIDDAIVVRENIFRHIENGEEPKVAAQKGTEEVKLAVIATTVTVIAVFLPVGFLQGMVGQFFKQFGLTVVFAMIISLFDALTTAPMLSAYMITKIDNSHMSRLGHIAHWPVEQFGHFQDWLDKVYERIMRYTLVHKVKVLLVAVAIALTSFGLVRFIPKTFMPTNEFGEFMVSLEADPGTSLSQMESVSTEIDSLIRKEKDVELVQLTVGNVNGESNTASLFVKMTPYRTRTRSTSELKAYLRDKLAPYAGRLKVAVNDISMAGDASPFQLIITGENLQELSDLADKLIPQFKNIHGLTDVQSNYRPGKPEFQVKMQPLKMEKLGVQSLAAGLELRGMVEGNTPAKYRENGLEYDIRVQLQGDQRDLSKEFETLYVPNVNNQLVKLKNIADPLQTTGPSKVFRRNRSRYVMITGNLTKDGAIGDITVAATRILNAEKLPEGTGYEFIGASEDMKDLFKNMLIAITLSILFIYLALASLYESVIVPLTIMMALPFSMVGAFLALLIMHESLNIFTMIGIIMLLGLVTKNSILLVDYTQRLMRQGMERNEALIKAGLTRLRPILMTTFALIAGMLPLALGLAEVAKFRKGMGIAIIGGLLSSTFLTLVVIPAIFGYMDSFRMWLRSKTGRPVQREIDKSA